MKETKTKKPNSNYYFTKDTENAILEYITTENQNQRNIIYDKKIDYAFHKLSQNIINTYKFPYMEGTTEDKQQEVIFHLLKGLDKYNPAKGAAYSYFGTAALRYCIYENKKQYSKLKSLNAKIDINEIDEVDNNNYKEEIDDMLFNDNSNYVLEKFLKYMDLYGEKIFLKDNLQSLEDYKTCNAIIELFKKKDDLEIFNKKAILLYIREQTEQSTQQITKISKKIFKIYNRLNNQYLDYGYINLNF